MEWLLPVPLEDQRDAPRPAALTIRKPSPLSLGRDGGQAGCCLAAKKEQKAYSLTQLLSQGGGVVLAYCFSLPFFFYQKIRAPFGASTDTTLGAGTGSCPVADWPSESPGLDYQDKDSARLSSHQPSPAALLPRKGSLVPPHPFQLGESSIPLAKPHGLWQSSRLAVITDCSRIDSELGCPKGAGVDEAAACL